MSKNLPRGAGEITSVLFQLGAAPFDNNKTVSRKGRQFQRLDLDERVERFPCHKDAEHAVRRGNDDQLCVFGVGIGLECDEIVGVAFHAGEPVDDKLIRLAIGQPHRGEGVLQKDGCFMLRDDKSAGEVVVAMWIFEAVAVWTTVVTVVCVVDPSVFASCVQAVSKKSIAFFIVVASFVSGEKSSLPMPNFS